MNDFNINRNELSIPARMTLKTIDDYLNIMVENHGVIMMTELDLHHARWEELETSLRWNSDEDDELSLKTHTYRGVRIVRKEWEE